MNFLYVISMYARNHSILLMPFIDLCIALICITSITIKHFIIYEYFIDALIEMYLVVFN